MKVIIRTSEINFNADLPKYHSGYEDRTIGHLKELIEKVAQETVKIKERKLAESKTI